jgi:hypothetical protein
MGRQEALYFFSIFCPSCRYKYGIVDPHGGHQFFQSARAVREISFSKKEKIYSLALIQQHCPWRDT